MNLTIPDVEKRLQDRYQQLVQEHAGQAHPTASGPRLLPDEASAKAGAMAAWRFYANPRTTPPRLAQPLLAAAADLAGQHCRDFALVKGVHPRRRILDSEPDATEIQVFGPVHQTVQIAPLADHQRFTSYPLRGCWL